MGYYDNILNLLSLVMVVSILFIVLFGCQFKRYRRYERFTNIEDKDEEHENKIDEIKSKPEPETEDKKEEFNTKETLEGFEGHILSGLTDGSITSKDMDKLISTGTFTKQNLENIIEYVEKFKKIYS